MSYLGRTISILSWRSFITHDNFNILSLETIEETLSSIDQIITYTSMLIWNEFYALAA